MILLQSQFHVGKYFCLQFSLWIILNRAQIVLFHQSLRSCLELWLQFFHVIFLPNDIDLIAFISQLLMSQSRRYSMLGYCLCFWQTIDMYSCMSRNNLKLCTACRITWSTGETFSSPKLYWLLKRQCHINCGKFLVVPFQFPCWKLLYVWRIRFDLKSHLLSYFWN